MLALKTWWLPDRLAWFHSAFQFEGVSILANTGATVLGMVAGSALFPPQAGVEKFFAALDRPIQPGEVPGRKDNSSGPVLGLATMAVGTLLIAAGVLSGSAQARWIDLPVGGVFLAVGILFRTRRSEV